MKTYVLGPNAARKLKGLFAGQGKVSSRKMSSPGVAFDSEYVAPFTVQWAQSANDGAGAWIIWLPSDSLLDVSGDRIDVSTDLEPVGGEYPEGWFVLEDSMLSRESGGVLYLNVRRDEGDEAGGVGEDAAKFVAEFSSEDGYRDQGDEAVVASIVICECGVAAGARTVRQFVSSVLLVGAAGCNPDLVSIGFVTDEDAEDPSAIQVKDFDNDESDGGQGLAQRLEVEKSGSGESATYKIKAKSNDSKVHLVARVNGKLKYIPISGAEEKDDDEKTPTPNPDECIHPGDRGNEGGVNPNDGIGHGGGGGHVDGGGVSPGDGGIHPGDDGCNCDN